MMKPVRTAIIGMGKMGKIRYNAMKRHGGYDIAAVCDVSSGVLDEFTAIRGFLDWRECLAETKPEAVIVCTYNRDIAEIVCYALERSIHVFSEKPPGRNLRETELMAKTHKRSGSILKFGFNHRYHNSIIEAKTLIDHKLLGDLVCARGVYGKAGNASFESEWRNNRDISGGGILLDQGIHMLDLLCYFCGEFIDVQSSVSNLVWRNMDTEDSAFAILKTADGKTASLHSSAIQWKHKFDLDLICTNGYIALNGLLTATQSYGEERITYYHKDLSSGRIGNPAEHTMCFSEDNSWDYEMTEFYDAVRRGVDVKNGTIYDAVKVMKLMQKVYVG